MSRRPSITSGALALVALFAIAGGIVLAQFLPTDFLGLRQGMNSPSTSTADGPETPADPTTLWTCGMHPHVLEEEPGQCPICGMNLTPVAGASPAADDPVFSANWQCPDHPQIVEEQPGWCPIDGLELIQVAPEETEETATESTRPTSAVVSIEPAVQQNMNVRLAKVTRQDLRRPIRTVAYMEYDPQRMVTVTPKYSGWVEKVHVNYVGERVKKGQPLFEIYSPELVQTERELLSALRFAEAMSEAPEDARQRALSLVESARIRLGYWDIPPEQIASIEATGEVLRTLEVRAPASGSVMSRMVGLEGMAVRPGMELFHLADLSSLWLEAELFEDQVAWVREGMEARIELSYFPGETITGRVRYIEPAFSEATRTMRVKIEVPNRDGRLRKGMYATVELQPVLAPEALVVPVEAILRSGTRDVVVVAEGGGFFMPQEVELGLEAGGFAQILSGLAEGTDIVTSAQFLLDSESSLRESIQKLIAARSAPADAASQNGEEPPGHVGH